MFHKYYQKWQFEVNCFSYIKRCLPKYLTVRYLEQKVTTDRHFYRVFSEKQSQSSLYNADNWSLSAVEAGINYL